MDRTSLTSRAFAAAIWAAFLFAVPSTAQVGFDLEYDEDIGVSFGRKPSGVAASVTLAAPAYTRTVTASSYTLTGTSTGSGAVTWAASPSGSSGACTGTDTFSCVVTVTPDATGEGVETITVTRGSATDTETLGFYVAGAHSVFLSQNVNGAYNAGLANLDAVATWENVGTSALDVTQATGAAQPTFRTGIVGGQPVVRCDGGDRLVGAAAADWAFLNDGTDFSTGIVYATTSSNPNVISALWSTQTVLGGTSRGTSVVADDRLASGREDQAVVLTSSGTTANINLTGLTDGLPAALFNQLTYVLDDDGGAGVDGTDYANGTLDVAVTRAGAYSASAPGTALSICAQATTFFLTGDVFRVFIYQSALTSTQRGINKAVDEWALGGTLPVTP